MSGRGVALVVAAHADDEVLGAGGSIARWAAEGWAVHVLLLADGESSRPAANEETSAGRAAMDARASAAHRAGEILGCASVETLRLPDNRMDTVPLLDVIQQVEARIQRHKPSRVLTHHSGDVNVDHTVTHNAVLAACRPQGGNPVRELLFFEVPSSTEWRPPGSGMPFHPNMFVDISATLEKKLAALGAYESEMRSFPHPRSAQAVEELARWRGASAGFGAAEAFMVGRQLV